MEPEKKPETKSPVFLGKGMIALIVGIVIILVAILAVGVIQAGQGTVVPPVVCGPKAVAYINQNLAQGGVATLISINESKGLYQLKIDYQSQAMTMYATKDCTLLFTDVVNMAAGPAGQATQQATPQATTAPVKSARPTVDLYVMSFCPYGTQAETAMGPVVDLLTSKADIRIRYITTISGTTVDSVNSLHGPAEAKEDLRQICINKYYPGQTWSYIKTFNEQCYPSWQNATALASCQKNTLAALSLDSAKIDTCSQGTEGLDLLTADEAAAGKDGATASPMLFINGVLYSGARTPDAYKQAICNSFDTAPAECSTVLSSTSSSGTTGGC
jgi:glutaredoxin